MSAIGVLNVNNGIQVILGGKADLYSQEINDILAHPEASLESAPASKAAVSKPASRQTPSQPSNRPHSHETITFTAPVDGELVALEKVHDDVFAKKMMGEGFAIEPANGQIYAPVSGTIQSIFKTKHAIGITTDDGLDVLLHLGLDMVTLKGKPFTIKVKEGDHIEPMTKLAEVDLDEIKDAGKDPIVLTLITNWSDVGERVKTRPSSGKSVKRHEKVFAIETK